ncbi:Gfo/Idh/MocA family protein [Vineibacter terrae]|uniref:Gfo/Idh/MocA family protein n=1 Tax=Vineibacter terrae TaxID=2586908 RepID=UPI0015B46999|nr:Gfo/Idh/MocA family oxidoreductase [Vineibacter terrae]
MNGGGIAQPAIGLVGFGRWGRHIFRDLRALGATVHVAVPGDASRQAAAEAGAASVQANLSALPEVDGYMVATPTATHAQVIAALLARNRPIFVEKPLTNDVDAARHLVEQAADRLFVMDKWRYHPGIRALAQQARSGALGEILAVRTLRLGWDNPHRDVDAVWILLPHDLSIVLEILGALPAAQAAFSTVPGRPGSDLIAVLHDGPGSAQVTIEVSSHHPTSRRAVVVVGTKGVAQLPDSYDDRILTAAGVPGEMTSKPTDIAVGGEMPLLLELEAFVAHLRGGPPPRSSAREGLMIVERIHALRRLAGLP